MRLWMGRVWVCAGGGAGRMGVVRWRCRPGCSGRAFVGPAVRCVVNGRRHDGQELLGCGSEWARLGRWRCLSADGRGGKVVSHSVTLPDSLGDIADE